jgi:hypothetical protein
MKLVKRRRYWGMNTRTPNDLLCSLGILSGLAIVLLATHLPGWEWIAFPVGVVVTFCIAAY